MSLNFGDNRNLFLKLKSNMGLYHVVLTTPKTSPKKLHWLYFKYINCGGRERVFPKKIYLAWNGQYIMVGKSMCKFTDGYRQVEYCHVTLPKQLIPQRYWNWSEVQRIPVTSGKTSLSLEIHWHILQAVHCTGWYNYSWLKQTPSRMDVFFLVSIFRLYPGLRISFEHNIVRKNLFQSACFCGDCRLFLREMDQKFKTGGTIDYGHSFLEFSFRQFQVLRLHAILHDAAGGVQAHSGKALGYYYVIGWGPNSCLLGHVTRLLFCLYVKLLLPSIFNSVDFWSRMSCILLDTELADKGVFKELGVFVDGKVQGYSFRPPKKFKPKKQAFWCTRNLHRIVWNPGCLDYSELSNILPRAVKG